MRAYMKSYIDEIDNYLKEEKKENIKKVIEEHLIKIQKKIGRREKILPFEKRRNFKVIQDNKILRKGLKIISK